MRTVTGASGLVVVVGLAGLVGSCGSSSSSPGSQFCQSWASAFCQKLYACTPVDQRDANFLGGSSQSQCTSIWTQTCADPPPQGATFDVNCSGGAHVDTAAKTACLNELSTISCDDFNSPTYVSVCDQVCGSSGSGGTGGTGGTGSGGAAGDPHAFCEALNGKTCELAFACTATSSMDATFAAIYGTSLGECQGSKTSARCANATCMPSYDPISGNSCIQIFSLYTCADIVNNLPADCAVACPVAGNADGGVDAAAGAGGGTGGSSGGAGGGSGGKGGGSGGAGGGVGGVGGKGGSGGASGSGGTSPGSNLIINGDFSNGLTEWGITLQAGSLTNSGVVSGQLCVTLGAYTTVTLGWPSDTSTVFSLPSGGTYQLSYQARTTIGLAGFEIQVGQGVAPYTQIDFMTQADVPGSQLDTFTHTFSPALAEPQGGFAFNAISGAASGTVLCVDNVSLTAVN